MKYIDNNGHVIVKEASTGIGAFELLVDPVSQVAYPEHGPNMMWNLKYSSLNHENMMGQAGSAFRLKSPYAKRLIRQISRFVAL